MGFLKRQLLKVIEWTDDSSDTILSRFEVPDRYAIMKGSQLTVRESQMAIFVAEGKIADIFGPGRYKLDTANLPLLTVLFAWKYGWETPYTGEVYFVNTKQFTNQKWGTANPIMMRDKDFGMIRLRGYGIFSFRVNNAEKLMKEISGTNKIFKTDAITEQLRKMIISSVTDAIAESKVPALDLATQYNELSEATMARLAAEFNGFGLELSSFYIENLSLPEEVEKTMDQRTSMGVLGDKMNTFTQYQAAQALRDAAQNTGGGLAGAGVGLGAGLGLAGVFTDALRPKDNASAQDKTPSAPMGEAMVRCPKCTAEVKASAKFCPECGEKMAAKKFCPECGNEVKANAKFCPECGFKF